MIWMKRLRFSSGPAARPTSRSPSAAMTLGLNHLTFAVTDVARAVDFYVDVLGCTKVAVWHNGAYARAADV
jgi:catechol-2,3-dioxygenase